MTEIGVSYFGVRRVAHVRSDMDDLARIGATYVVHLMTEHDLANYRATMRGIVETTHDAGLNVWLDPVAIGHIFGGTEFPSELALLRPELAQRDDLGRALPSACPSRSAVRAVFHEWIDAAVETGADTLFWDEPHLWIGSWYNQPDRSACYCEACEEAFVTLEGRPMPRDPRDSVLIAFRRRLMLEFLADLLGYAKGLGARNSVTLLPSEMDADAGLSFEAVAGLGVVDELGTDPYPFPAYDGQPNLVATWPEFVRGYAERVVDVTRRHGLVGHLWVQGFSVPRDDGGYLTHVFDVVKASGITNLAIWGFDGHRDMSRFACEDPDLAWAAIVDGIARARGMSA